MGVRKAEKEGEYYPEANFKIGDEVVVCWLTDSEIGEITSKPFHAFSPLAGGKEEVMVKFKDREKAVWIALINKIERREKEEKN